jgi:dipeptidyl aminopeptidase/acylaminoacyl peptidase
LLASVFLLAAVRPAGAALPVLTLADMSRLVALEEPAISPDAKRIAFIVITQDVKHDAYVNSLALLDLATNKTRTILKGKDTAVPRWSPDGSRLAYLAQTSGDEHQLFVREGELSRQLTKAKGDVVDEAWSPDGRELAFVAADPHDGAPFFYAGDNDYTATELTPPEHLWIVPASGGTARRLTSGSWTIAPTDPGGIFSPQIAWAADGRSIAIARVANTFSGDDEYSTLWQVDVGTGALRKLTAHSAFELSPSYSPDGTRLAYWYPRGGDFNAETTVRIRDGDRDDAFAGALDRNIAASLWFPDGRLLLCAASETSNLFYVAQPDGTTSPIPLGEIHPICDPYSSSTFDGGAAASIANDGTIAFIATTPASARELYLLRAGSKQPQRLTHYNDFLAGIATGAMSELRWSGPGGFAEDGVVIDPPNPAPGRKYPIVLLIHGGPGLSSQRDFVWEQWPLAQAIASRGYVVFAPNYRGSDNLGNAYMTAIVHDTVAGPSSDILAGLTALGARPEVDSTRVAVSGWSYGGELTSWLIGHYHFWRAAISGAAVNNEFDEYNLSTSNVQDRYPLGASPWTQDGQRIYRENSPITYYAQITTPTLIWGTTQDPVVPITQSYELFHALTENHVPVRFAVFPAATHGPDSPRQSMELTKLWLDWLATYLTASA